MRLLFSTIPFLAALTVVSLLHDSGSAEACAGLIGSNGAVNLGRTTTLAAYHDGIEHYVTAFEFQGAGSKFGSIVPLPGVPTRVIKAGRWTLQRLELEVSPPVFAATAESAGGATAGAVQVILKTKIDALDVTVLKGGGPAVGN